MGIRAMVVAAGLAVGLAACAPTRGDEDLLLGMAAGAALGAITAEVLLNDDDWVLVGALGGAAAGALVARNRERERCAYSRGDGTYYVARCR